MSGAGRVAIYGRIKLNLGLETICPWSIIKQALVFFRVSTCYLYILLDRSAHGDKSTDFNLNTVTRRVRVESRKTGALCIVNVAVDPSVQCILCVVAGKKKTKNGKIIPSVSALFGGSGLCKLPRVITRIFFPTTLSSDPIRCSARALSLSSISLKSLDRVFKIIEYC